MPTYECKLEDLTKLMAEHATIRKKSVKKALKKSAERLKDKISERKQVRAKGEAPEDGRIPVVSGTLERSGEVVETEEGDCALVYKAPYAAKVERKRRFVMAAMPEYQDILDEEVKKALKKV